MKAGQESRGRGQDKMKRKRVGKEMDEARSSSKNNRKCNGLIETVLEIIKSRTEVVSESSIQGCEWRREGQS